MKDMKVKDIKIPIGQYMIRFYLIPICNFGPFNIYGHRGVNFGRFGISINPYPHSTLKR